ncbi:SUR7/PalI family-domain-containing protein [Xylaria bambusicola]|uniref:SUR7/PalI family-domain-containing protein n=1 Tax=Xylaria bambusicola TaxID=326684 RepID=UPI00200869FE|nr:SUR7/PalI family-domain-containing protein [Xylaria bambusicola]KAI0503065.1 SUR7/PalI family-domain-containing protein [Xylaria bambusicola]
MAARMSTGPSWALAILLSLISLVFTLVTLLSGVGSHTTASYLTVDTTDLAIPAKLSGSIFLQDLSKISGSDFVGQDKTRESLGLSNDYSVSLLTACGRNDDGSSSCYAPRVGFTFNPGSNLKLDRSAAQYGQLRTYAEVSTFVAVAYIVSALLTLLSCTAIVLSRRFERAILISRISSGLVAILLSTATVASIVTFVKLRDSFNSALSDVGVKTATDSTAFGLSAAASVAAIIAFALTFFIRPTASGYRLPLHREKQNTYANETELMSRESRPANVGPGFMDRMQPWNRPRYAQIETNKLDAHSRDHSPDSDREGLINPGEDDGLHNANHDPTWANTGARQNLDHVSTAYKPSV